jgi:thymidylate synthase ThyX
MKAQLIYDGTTLHFPSSQRPPASNQDKGTTLERLAEIACRICYDSYGVDEDGKRKGRSSSDLHKHILEVQNHSIFEHCTFTIALPSFSYFDVMHTCLNRKGIWIEMAEEGIELTVNFRAVLEWDRYSTTNNYCPEGEDIHKMLLGFAHQLAPQVFPEEFAIDEGILKTSELNENQAWVTLWLSGSRGWSHEQVRHRFAMSQRSTRYVDESESDYVMHPLISEYLISASFYDRRAIREQIARSIAADRATYEMIVGALEGWLLERGVDKATARKQARGAGRGYLGNGLSTEMIYSAPISGWKWIFSQRLAPLADKEMQIVMVEALDCLRQSQYGDQF